MVMTTEGARRGKVQLLLLKARHTTCCTWFPHTVGVALNWVPFDGVQWCCPSATIAAVTTALQRGHDTIAGSDYAPIHSTQKTGFFSFFSSFSAHWWQILCGTFLASCSVIKFLSSKQTGHFSILSVHNENHFWWYGMQWEWDRAGFSLVMWCNVMGCNRVQIVVSAVK